MKRYVYLILPLIFTLQILGGTQMFAQVKVNVVSQKISESIDWKPGMSLQLTAERAEIFCSTHTANTIEFEVVFISKHENIAIAEDDLKKMKWLNEVMNKKVFVRNYIELSRNETKPESDIKAIYHIKVPENCAVEISNYFGKIYVENLNFKLKINGEFSTIDLLNINGNSIIKSTFGDITANTIKGELHIESNRSDIDISNIEGILVLQSKVAEIVLDGIKKNTKIIIDAEKSKVRIKAEEFSGFFLNLDLYKTKLQIPDEIQLEFTKNEKETIKANFNKIEDHPQIDVKLNIGTLTLEQISIYE